MWSTIQLIILVFTLVCPFLLDGSPTVIGLSKDLHWHQQPNAIQTLLSMYSGVETCLLLESDGSKINKKKASADLKCSGRDKQKFVNIISAILKLYTSTVVKEKRECMIHFGCSEC